MRDHFRQARSGQVLSAEFLDRVSKIHRSAEAGAVGSNFAGQQHGQVRMHAMQPLFRGEILEVTRVANGGSSIYAKPLYYTASTGTWSICSDFDEVPVDHSLFTVTPDVGERFVGWWHDQRHAWVPMMGTSLDKKRSCVDVCCEDIAIDSDSEQEKSQVQWALERMLNEDDEDTWWKVNDRRYLIYLKSRESTVAAASGSGIYTFRLPPGRSYLRVSAFSNLTQLTTIDWAAIRIEATGEATTLPTEQDSPLVMSAGDAPTPLYRLRIETQCHNNASSGLPMFSIAGASSDRIQVDVPTVFTYGYLFEAEVTLRASVAAYG